MARYRLMSDFLDCELRDGAVPAKRSIVTAPRRVPTTHRLV